MTPFRPIRADGQTPPFEAAAAAGMPERGAAQTPAQLLVPLDGTPAAERALSMAVEIATRRPATIVLIGLLRACVDDLGIDPEWAGALRIAAEPAPGAPPPCVPPTGEDRVAALLWRTLLPAQRRVRAAGLTATVRVLRSAGAAEALCAAPGPDRGGRAVVLSNPLRLQGPLRELTGALLIRPPCTLYVTGLERPERPLSIRLVHWLVRRVWHPQRDQVDA